MQYENVKDSQSGNANDFNGMQSHNFMSIIGGQEDNLYAYNPLFRHFGKASWLFSDKSSNR